MVTVEKIKAQAKLLDYGDNEDAKQITDEEIQSVIDEASSYYNQLLSGLDVNTDFSFKVDRLISLEVIVRLCLSNYNDNQKSYIESLKAERDSLKLELEKNIRLFTTSRKVVSPPKMSGTAF